LRGPCVARLGQKKTFVEARSWPHSADRSAGRQLPRLREAQGRAATQEKADYPRIEDGVRGVRFIEKTVASSASSVKWTAMR